MTGSVPLWLALNRVCKTAFGMKQSCSLLCGGFDVEVLCTRWRGRCEDCEIAEQCAFTAIPVCWGEGDVLEVSYEQKVALPQNTRVDQVAVPEALPPVATAGARCGHLIVRHVQAFA